MTLSIGSPRLGALLVAALLAAGALGGCGSDEREFSADEFVREANDHGAGLELGESLTGSDSGAELYELTFSSNSATGEAAEGTGGSLRVTDTTQDAEGEFNRCQEAGLICYQAANVVVNLQQEIEPRMLDRLGRAVKALKSD
jgi:hypothetical protein